MKSRVALAATLLTLLALILLVVLSCVSIVEERNNRLSDDVQLALRLVSGSAPSGTDAEGFSALSQYLRKSGMRLGIYTQKGDAVYASDGTDAPLAEIDFDRARTGGSGVYEKRGIAGKRVLCATGLLPDGRYLQVSVAREGFWQSLGGSRSAIFACFFLGISLTFFIVLITLNARRSRAIGRIMDVLDSFSDGRFDTRLTQTDGFSKDDVAEYNAVLSRIDERIFNQRSRNQALSVVMNQMQNGIIAVDDKLRVILVTPVAKRLLGITGNAQGMHINDASQDVRLDQVLLDAMQQIGVYTNEVAARTAIGRGHRPLRLYVSPMRKDNKVVGALSMVEDITELRRLEQLRTDFAANVSHELKTPLTSIRGFVETLLDGALEKPEMAKKFLSIIMLETERLTRLINDILSISKLESGMVEAPKERIRLDKEAHDVVEMLAIHA
ncbi:MAG: sensor histidine kinase, partial [Christensenellales bacterium]